MLEVEIKLRLTVDINALSDVAVLNGYVFEKEVTETDDYFLINDEAVLKNDFALRVRRRAGVNENVSFLCLKGTEEARLPHIRREIEFAVSDWTAAEEMLIALGYLLTASVSKTRKYFKKGDFALAVDEVKELGTFAELEIMLPDSGDRISAEKAIKTEIQTIFPEGKPETDNYLKLILSKRGFC